MKKNYLIYIFKINIFSKWIQIIKKNSNVLRNRMIKNMNKNQKVKKEAKS